MKKLIILESKKVQLICLSILVVLTIVVLFLYYSFINKKEKMSIPVSVMEGSTEKQIDLKTVEELPEDNEQESEIEETTENNEKPENNNEYKKDDKKDDNKKNNNTPTYYIKVNYGAQVVTIYTKDANGDYTVPYKSMVCSTGSATPKSGVYSIPSRWKWGALFGGVYGQYVTKITGNILFHSVPYLRNGDTASLEYWEYDKLGTNASAGCVRLTVNDAKWIYNNCTNGTKVEFYSSSDTGPLGKPSAKKISSYPDYLRNWDPTDPDSRNPWKTYKQPEITPSPATPVPSQTPSSSPIVSPEPSANPTPSIVPSESPKPSEEPTVKPSPTVTPTPSFSPSGDKLDTDTEN